MGPSGNVLPAPAAKFTSPGGRVKFLTDTDADGQYDKATFFLEGLRMPTGVAPWRDGVLVTVAGEILWEGRPIQRRTRVPTSLAACRCPISKN